MKEIGPGVYEEFANIHTHIQTHTHTDIQTEELPLLVISIYMSKPYNMILNVASYIFKGI